MAVVSGEEAARCNAVRLDSFLNVNDGELVEADDVSGLVRWRDRAGEVRETTLGAGAIRITRRGR